MKKYRLFLFIIILTNSLFAQESDTFFLMESFSELKAEIQNVSQNTASIKSKFVQEKHLTMLEEVLVSNGHFLFRKENDVRWEYLSPIDYTIIIYDGKFSIKNGDKVSEFDIGSNALFQEINKMIVTAIRGDFIDNPEFEASFFENRTQYRINLKALNKQVSGMLTQIEIYLNKSNFAVEQVKFSEPGDDYTLIIFIDREVNTEISDKQFEFEND